MWPGAADIKVQHQKYQMEGEIVQFAMQVMEIPK